jgi:hypothetical protein
LNLRNGSSGKHTNHYTNYHEHNFSYASL